LQPGEEKAGSVIRKHDHLMPSREMRRDVRAPTARNHPFGVVTGQVYSRWFTRFRVQGLRYRLRADGFRLSVQGLGFRVQVLRFRVKSFSFRFSGFGSSV